MRTESSVVTALAELGRMEHERVEGERRRAAEQRVRRLEQALAHDANERLERELASASARLRADHEAHEAELHARLRILEGELIGARASVEALREALAAREVRPAFLGLSGLLIALLACGVAGWTMLENARLSEQVRSAAAYAPPIAVPHAAIDAPPERSSMTEPASSKTTAELKSATKPIPAPNAERPAADRATKRVKKTRPTEAGTNDPLGPIEDCKDDPTCGL